MATASILQEPVRPLRRVEYDKLVEAGVFEDERVELLYGIIIRMSPIGPPHASAVAALNELLILRLAGRASVRVQSSIEASDDSQPEPDVAVVPRNNYRQAHPSDALLIIEVADSSLTKDRGIKAKLYAECGVPEYWVVNVRDDLVEVHTEIVGGAYTRVEPHRPGSRIRLTAFPDVEIDVRDIL